MFGGHGCYSDVQVLPNIFGLNMKPY
jgi:hypothetical protein